MKYSILIVASLIVAGCSSSSTKNNEGQDNVALGNVAKAPKNEAEAYDQAQECVMDFLQALWEDDDAKGQRLCVEVPLGGKTITAYSLAKARNTKIDPAKFKIEMVRTDTDGGNNSVVVVGSYNEKPMWFRVQFYEEFGSADLNDDEDPTKLVIRTNGRILSTMGLYEFDNETFKAENGFEIDCREPNYGECYSIYNDDMAPYLMQEQIVDYSKILIDFLNKRGDGTKLVSAGNGTFCSNCAFDALLNETEIRFECSDDSAHWVNYFREVDVRGAYPLNAEDGD